MTKPNSRVKFHKKDGKTVYFKATKTPPRSRVVRRKGYLVVWPGSMATPAFVKNTPAFFFAHSKNVAKEFAQGYTQGVKMKVIPATLSYTKPSK